MCINYVKIKKTTKSGISYAFVPCGHCADCRRKAQEAWQFRLFSEFLTLKQQGWNLGFITLTYSEDSLPHIPEECFRDKSQYKSVPCFDRQTVSDWIHQIRHYCKYHYHMTHERSLRYFVASEYGSETHRPHYHCLLAWPSEMSYEEMHSLCKHYWTSGLVAPKRPDGDAKCQSFEIVGDPSHAVGYVSKYACKDVFYLDVVDGLDLYSRPKDYADDTDEHYYAKMYQNCVPFHIQSRSLGMELFKGLSDDERRDVLVNGMQLTGDDKLYSAPIYIRNKLIFDNYYVFDEDGKRLCRRKANGFFEAHKDEIFEKKADWWQRRLTGMSDAYLEQSGVAPDMVEKLGYILQQHWCNAEAHCSPSTLNAVGKYYLAYNAVQEDRCFDIPLAEQWILRYREPKDVDATIAVANWPLVDNYELSWLRPLWDVINICYSYSDAVGCDDRDAQERLEKEINDFFNNL